MTVYKFAGFMLFLLFFILATLNAIVFFNGGTFINFFAAIVAYLIAALYWREINAKKVS